MFQLPANVFAEIVGHSDVTFEPSKNDKRQQPRVHISRRAQVLGLNVQTGERPGKSRPDGRAPALPVIVRDVSLTGAGLYATFALKAGVEFVLLLPTITGTTAPLLCRAMRSQACGKTAWSVGVAFAALLKPDEATPEAVETRRIRKAILAG